MKCKKKSANYEDMGKKILADPRLEADKIGVFRKASSQESFSQNNDSWDEAV